MTDKLDDYRVAVNIKGPANCMDPTAHINVNDIGGQNVTPDALVDKIGPVFDPMVWMCMFPTPAIRDAVNCGLAHKILGWSLSSTGLWYDADGNYTKWTYRPYGIGGWYTNTNVWAPYSPDGHREIGLLLEYLKPDTVLYNRSELGFNGRHGFGIEEYNAYFGKWNWDAEGNADDKLWFSHNGYGPSPAEAMAICLYNAFVEDVLWL
jgi:hypothetical protein